MQKLYLLQIDFWNIQKKPPEIKEKETKIRLRTKECGALTITSNICKGLIYLYKPGIVQSSARDHIAFYFVFEIAIAWAIPGIESPC